MPTSILLIGAVAAVGTLLDWAPLGVVLRGFRREPRGNDRVGLAAESVTRSCAISSLDCFPPRPGCR